MSVVYTMLRLLRAEVSFGDALPQAIIARTFDYESEAKCDAHLKTFLRSIKAAAASEGQGFAAIKVPCHNRDFISLAEAPVGME